MGGGKIGGARGFLVGGSRRACLGLRCEVIAVIISACSAEYDQLPSRFEGSFTAGGIRGSVRKSSATRLSHDQGSALGK